MAGKRRDLKRRAREIASLEVDSVAHQRRLAASGVLGAPRLHYTVATGEIATKEAAACYAMDVFEPRWHGPIEDAIAYWRGEPPSEPYRKHPHRRYHDAVEFVTCVIDAANRLTPHTD